MIFETRLHGIPCRCEILDDDPEDGIDFVILDRRGRPAPWLAKYLTQTDEIRLLKEYKDTLADEERYAY